MRLLRSCLLWLIVYAAGYVALAAAADVVLGRLFPPPYGRYAALGIAGLCVALSGFFWRAWRAEQERSLLAQACGGFLHGEPGKPAVVVGQLQPLGAPLEAPFSAEPCVAYEYEVLDPDRRSRSGHARDYRGMALTPCEVRGSTVALRVLGWPRLEGFGEQTREGPDVSERAAAYIAETSFESASWACFGSVFGAGKDMLKDVDGTLRRDLRLGETAPDLSTRRFSERVVPVGARVCAYGAYATERKGLAPDPAAGICLRLVAGDATQALRAARRRAVRHVVTGTLLLAVAIGAGVALTATVSPSFGEALIAAARSGDLRELQGLLEAGADVDSRGAGGETALMLAPDEATARFLVAHGADVNVADLGGSTPLMLAAGQGDKKRVELYLAAGADVTVTNKQRKTALDVAREKGHQELVELLLAARERQSSP